ncbi:glycoside hydrolase family 27 protein [Novosphingobium sp. 1949]|uniref:Alpha-galactosidase n=1 Tax=Novosphingobium organovorum TaxID=2930092 RepID=A0ABT0BFA6_9SPHN|nr:glycoside hydrolase family 27 protein [Novosphingobium organovorum]MCJ2183585.1 glycoside hydrolase family 27 protein [Novosphingobium organovorum]
MPRPSLSRRVRARALLAATAIALYSTSALPAQARSAFDGVWLFDGTPATPGISMMDIRSKGSAIEGEVTTAWYGAIPMHHARIEKGELVFEADNINDRDHPTQTWHVALRDGKARLTGKIWYHAIDVTGTRGSSAQGEARAFHPVPLPAMGAPLHATLAPTPPMGWSSWNSFGAAIDDATVRAMADAMVSSGLRDAGYTYVNIDDGWQGTRGADGALRPNAKFPDMKALTAYVHARGLKIGIYSSQGPKTCAGYTGSYGHVQQDAQTFADWGFDYLKYDLCSGEWFYNDRDTVMRSYYAMGKALQETGRAILFSLCEYGRFDVGEWGRSVGGELWRTTGDITDNYATMAKIGFDHNGKPANAGPHGWNDPDMLEIGNGGMSPDEYRSHMALWAMSAAPLMMGHDLRKSDAATLAILTNPRVIAIDQDPRGVQGQAMRKDGTREVWAKPLADGRVALALFNRGESAIEAPLTPADAGLASVSRVEDAWSGTTAPALVPLYSVPAHGVVLLIVSP